MNEMVHYYQKLSDNQNIEALMKGILKEDIENEIAGLLILNEDQFIDNMYAHPVFIKEVRDYDNSFQKLYSLILYPFIEKLESIILHYRSIFTSPSDILNESRNQLGEILSVLSDKVIMNEINLLSEEGYLEGETKEEQFEYFFNRLIFEKTYMKILLSSYPRWFDLLGKVLQETISYYEEIFVHFVEDFDELKMRFQLLDHELKINSVELSLGDRHNYKSVARVSFNRAELLYKPRSAPGEQLFENFFEYINHLGNNQLLELKVPKFLSKDGHSWVEKVAYRECSNEVEVANFYQRIG